MAKNVQDSFILGMYNLSISNITVCPWGGIHTVVKPGDIPDGHELTPQGSASLTATGINVLPSGELNQWSGHYLPPQKEH